MPWWSRKKAAEEISERYFPISERTLLHWPIATVILNGKACAEDTAWCDEAERRLQAMLENQGGHLAPLQAAARANAGRADARERRQQVAEKLRAGKRREKGGEVVVTT